MPNYQNGKIYKITSSHTDLCYIGSTSQKYLAVRFGGHKTIYKRWKEGKGCYYASCDILQYEDAKIELIEKFPCDIVEELTKREGEFIKEYGDNCVNRRIEGRTQKQRYQDNKEVIKEQKKQYRLDNIDKIKEYKKQYNLEHKDELREKKKQYRLDNIDKIKEYKKQYRLDNIDKIKEYKKHYYISKQDEFKQKATERYENKKDEILVKNKERYENKKDEILVKCKEYKLKTEKYRKQKHDCECGGKYTTEAKTKHFKTKLHQTYTSSHTGQVPVPEENRG
jgi:hypothetical protein